MERKLSQCPEITSDQALTAAEGMHEYDTLINFKSKFIDYLHSNKTSYDENYGTWIGQIGNSDRQDLLISTKNLLEKIKDSRQKESECMSAWSTFKTKYGIQTTGMLEEQ